MLTLSSDPKGKNRVDTHSLVGSEKDVDIPNANTTKVNRLSDTDKEILKVLLSPGDGIKHSSIASKKQMSDIMVFMNL
jgi:hypothetical protein